MERQRKDTAALCAQRGYEILARYTDNDISASTKKRRKPRPDYDAMLAAARAGELDVIVAYKSSRLTRRPREHEDLIELAVDYGIQFAYVASPEFDLNTADGPKIARMLAVSDAGDAEVTRELVQRKMRELAEVGRPSGPPTVRVRRRPAHDPGRGSRPDSESDPADLERECHRTAAGG